jgi:hypothetical protein
MRRIWGHATNIYIFTSNHRDGTRKLVRLWGEEMAGVDQWGDPTVPHGHGLRKTINNLIVSRMELSSMRRPEVARMVTFGMLWNHLPGYLSVFFQAWDGYGMIWVFLKSLEHPVSTRDFTKGPYHAPSLGSFLARINRWWAKSWSVRTTESAHEIWQILSSALKAVVHPVLISPLGNSIVSGGCLIIGGWRDGIN